VATKTVLTNFRIDAETHKNFRLWCLQNDTTVSDHIRGLIDETLRGEINAEFKRAERPAKKKEADLAKWLEDEWG